MRILLYLVWGCYALVFLCLSALVLAPAETMHEKTIASVNTDSASTLASAPFLRITVVTPAHEEATSRMAPFGPGYDRELLAEFCKGYDCDIRWVRAKDRAMAFDMVRAGQADLAMGFAAASKPLPNLVAGPVYYHSRLVEVQARQVYLPTPVYSNPSAADAALAVPMPRSDALPLAAPELRIFRLNERAWALWQPFTPLSDSDHVSATAGLQEDYQWFWNPRNASLSYRMRAFWTHIKAPDNTLLRRLDELYYGYLPPSIDPYGVQHLLHIVQKRLPRYSQTIARASSKSALDPLLFTAVIIQESGMDESTVSHTGVRGIMQLTTRTAAYLGVDRLNPTAAIVGGARYLNMLWKNLEDLDLTPWDRWFFTLAAFNQGPRRLEGAMELSRKLGGTGRSWEELKTIFPLLTQQKYASMVGQTVCRGQEAVNFVERVRLSYHILHGLVALGRPEAENLGPLLNSFGRAIF